MQIAGFSASALPGATSSGVPSADVAEGEMAGLDGQLPSFIGLFAQLLAGPNAPTAEGQLGLSANSASTIQSSGTSLADSLLTEGVSFTGPSKDSLVLGQNPTTAPTNASVVFQKLLQAAGMVTDLASEAPLPPQTQGVQAQPLSQNPSMGLVSKDPASELSDEVLKIEGRSGETEETRLSALADSVENLKDVRESAADFKSMMPQVGMTEKMADSLEWDDFNARLEQQAIQSVAKNEPDRAREVESNKESGFSPHHHFGAAGTHESRDVDRSATAHETRVSVADQIRHGIQSHLTEVKETGRFELRIQLDPPDLGQVRLHLSANQSQVDVHMFVHESGTLHMLEQQVDTIRSQLDAAGVEVGNFQMSSGTSGERDPSQPFTPLDVDWGESRSFRFNRSAVGVRNSYGSILDVRG